MTLKSQLRVLVVDDMSTSRGLISQALDEIGIKNYFTENDGDTAWRSMIGRPVHLVLSDFNMPRKTCSQISIFKKATHHHNRPTTFSIVAFSCGVVNGFLMKLFIPSFTPRSINS